MGIIAKDDNQITLIYNPETSLGKQVRAYAASSKAVLQVVDLSNQTLADSEWAEISSLLGKPLRDIISQDHPIFREAYGNKEIQLTDDHDAIKLLNKHPEIVVYPILIRGDQTIQAKTYADVLKLIESDSADIRIP
ncbi:hypothetical protein GCM10009117_08430 [Gangjinia marincola]|uniref:Arsenate reductase n=1 Tax=Gangjinia marincola TaxID=578463 RepID=A0ABN1MF02_9FLAO